MSNALDKLVEAALAEREQLQAEVDKLNERRTKVLAQLKQYDRVINAVNTNGAAPKPVAPAKPKKQDWRVSSGMVEQVHAQMVADTANGAEEFTIKDLASATGISDVTVQKAIHVLHEQGRVKLVRTHRQQRFWGVVA